MKSKGFTLIELIVVIGIMSLLASVGLVSYGNFTKKQIVQEEARKFVSVLRKAQNDAITGNKPSTCGDADSLVGYRVTGSVATNSYEVYSVCSDGVSTLQKNYPLDSRVSFTSNFDVTFLSPYGNSTGNSTISFIYTQNTCIENAQVEITSGGGIKLLKVAVC